MADIFKVQKAVIFLLLKAHSECQWREHSLRPLPFLTPFSFPIGISLLSYEASVPSVLIVTHGRLLGRSQAIQVGTSWKQVDQFLGVPYAAPPLAERRFRAPEPLNWTGSWDASKPRYGLSGAHLGKYSEKSSPF